MTDGSIYIIIAVTFFGFIGLAFVLLFPVWRFLHREERVSHDWTDDAIGRREAARSSSRTAQAQADIDGDPDA